MSIKWKFNDFKDFEKALLNGDFRTETKAATDEVAQTALADIKRMTPKKTGKLKAGWDENKSNQVKSTPNGFTVEMVNAVPYAYHVNDGHRVRNRKNGVYYKVKKGHRIKVPVAYEYQADPSDWYVFGHFFVERGLKSTKEKTKRIVNRRMDKWWKERFK